MKEECSNNTIRQQPKAYGKADQVQNNSAPQCYGILIRGAL
jgi:hypothetical protein